MTRSRVIEAASVFSSATIAVMLPVLKDAAAPEMMTSVLFAALWCWAVVPFVLGR